MFNGYSPWPIETLDYIVSERFMFPKNKPFTLVELIKDCKKKIDGKEVPCVITYNGKEYIVCDPIGFADKFYDQIKKEHSEMVKM